MSGLTESGPRSGRDSTDRGRPAGWWVLAGVGAWLAAAGGVIRLADIPGEYGDSLCGVWGCYPPLQALAAMHLLWVLALVPVVWVLALWQPRWLRSSGWGTIALAVVAATAVAGWDLSGWLAAASPEYRGDWPKRAAYTLATLSDVPFAQMFLAGLACVVLGRRPNRRTNP